MIKEDNKTKISDHNREIFMAILSDSTALEDLDYDEFLSETEASEAAAAAASYKIPPPPPGITVTAHVDNIPKKIFKTGHHQ